MAAPCEPRSSYVDLAGSRRHIVEWGERGAPVLVLQHGMRDHARSWDWVARHFAPTRHVVAPDLRGHGDSAWSPDGAYALSDFVSDLADIVEALGLAPFDLVGHSMGGHIALRYSAAFPEQVRSLGVIEGVELPIVRDQRKSPSTYPLRLRSWIVGRREGRTRTPHYYRTVALAQARMAQQHPAMDGATIAHLTRHGLIAEAGKGLRWKFDNACRWRAPDDAHGLDLDDVLDAVACRTFLAYGDASWIAVPSVSRLDRLSERQLTMFLGASHWLHHQAREPFIRALDEFLAQSNPYSHDKRTTNA